VVSSQGWNAVWTNKQNTRRFGELGALPDGKHRQAMGELERAPDKTQAKSPQKIVAA
jgi:hypothetical protein